MCAASICPGQRATIGSTARWTGLLFVFKQVRADDFRARVAAGWTDVEMLDWMKSTGVRRSAAEVHGWSDRVENDRPYGDPVRRQWFKGECERLD